MKSLFEYFAAARGELVKVTWPNRRQTARLTALVILFSIVFAVFLGGLDQALSALVKIIIVK